MNNSKVAITVSKTIGLVQMLVGIIIVFMFGLCTIMCLTDKEFLADTGIAFLIFCLVLSAVGVWLIVLSRKRNKLIKEFKKYVAAISCDPNGYLPDIAASLGIAENKLKTDLELMINKKYFANAFIDYNSNCIVVVNRPNQSTNTTQNQNTSTYSPPVSPDAVEMVTVTCRGCGGINAIQKGIVRECEYCGSSIKGE